MKRRFKTILVANRGEIALRIIKTAKALGYRTVAVASDADKDAPHAKAADQCLGIGQAPAAQSYLDQEALIEAAKASGADAIHPGYGFLSENAAFARRTLEAGLVFIGPSPEAIALMGDKAAAKRAMIEAGVPCIPGYEGEIQDDHVFVEAAREAGFPVMVKAAAGGGGRGMRRVEKESDLLSALSAARAEAQNAFGSNILILEKAIDRARHIEIQVFGDAHGNIIHLGERDCSLQRRHQKVIEEAPSPAVNQDLRQRMGQAAIDAARAVDYQGAGTVEFLLAEDGSFYFLEMNTRLQVEHPVTEQVTGLDLVALQIQVAQGQPLGLSQSEITLCGHAIEARLYAENPSAGFLPSTGPVRHWSAPSGVRIDAGIETGSEISSHYDPMVAKIIASGPDREVARATLIQALEDTALLGPSTNRQFLISLLQADEFAAGDARTTTIDEAPPYTEPPLSDEFGALAASVHHAFRARTNPNAGSVSDALRFWQSGVSLPMPYTYNFAGTEQSFLVRGGPSDFEVTHNGKVTRIKNLMLEQSQGQAHLPSGLVKFHYVADEATLALSTAAWELEVRNLAGERRSANGPESEGTITATMHGLLTDVFVAPGAAVSQGQRLALLEAMKMQHDVRAPIEGVIAALHAKPGDQVAGGDVILIIEPKAEDTQ